MALWIYTLIISTYFSNKNGFVASSFFSLSALRFSLFLFRFSSFPLRFLYLDPSRFFFFFFFLLIYPQSDSNSHSSSYLWFSCPSATPLHHWFVDISPPKIIFYLYLAMNVIKIQRNLHLNHSITKTPHVSHLLHEKMLFWGHPLVLWRIKRQRFFCFFLALFSFVPIHLRFMALESFYTVFIVSQFINFFLVSFRFVLFVS